MEKDNKKEILEIASELNSLVNKKLKEKLNDNEELRYKSHYEAVMHELNRELESANQMIDDYKENGFTLNALEMEGYRRGLTTMINEFKDWEKYLREERLLNLSIE